MALCTQCGMLMHEEDADTHVCDPRDIPDKGKPIRKGYKKEEI